MGKEREANFLEAQLGDTLSGDVSVLFYLEIAKVSMNNLDSYKHTSTRQHWL